MIIVIALPTHDGRRLKLVTDGGIFLTTVRSRLDCGPVSARVMRARGAAPSEHLEVRGQSGDVIASDTIGSLAS